MIGMAGDEKNKGSLIINMKSYPAEKGQPNNPDMGLLSAAKQIMSAIQANDPDTFSSSLKSFINMCNMKEKQSGFESELKEGQSGVDQKLESRNRIGKGY